MAGFEIGSVLLGAFAVACRDVNTAKAPKP